MKDRLAFWKGVVAGIFGGIAIGALTRLSSAETASPRRESAAPTGGATRPAPKIPGPFHQPAKILLRRDAAESAGDPRITGPVPVSELRQVAGKAFERPPGAPGGRTPAEILEAPGRPGQPMDHGTHAHKDEKAFPVP